MSSFRSFVDNERHVRVFARAKKLRNEIFKSGISSRRGYFGSGCGGYGKERVSNYSLMSNSPTTS